MIKATITTGIEKVNRYKLLDALKAEKGRMLTVDFVKADGSERTINGRLGVRKFTKGGTNKAVSQANANITIWSVRDGYRTINLDNVLSVRASKKVLLVAA